MPLDAMGEFETFASVFPFYPSVYLGRIVTEATHTIPDQNGNFPYYSFQDRGLLFVLILFGYLAIFSILTAVLFNKRLKNDC